MRPQESYLRDKKIYQFREIQTGLSRFVNIYCSQNICRVINVSQYFKRSRLAPFKAFKRKAVFY